MKKYGPFPDMGSGLFIAFLGDIAILEAEKAA